MHVGAVYKVLLRKRRSGGIKERLRRPCTASFPRPSQRLLDIAKRYYIALKRHCSPALTGPTQSRNTPTPHPRPPAAATGRSIAARRVGVDGVVEVVGLRGGGSGVVGRGANGAAYTTASGPWRRVWVASEASNYVSWSCQLLFFVHCGTDN